MKSETKWEAAGDAAVFVEEGSVGAAGNFFSFLLPVESSSWNDAYTVISAGAPNNSVLQ
jgi:hypothetical protein